MNIIKINYIVTKLFIIENVFILSILSAIFASVTLNKTIKFFIKTFKIMQLNKVEIVTANNMQRILNFNFYQFIVIVFLRQR